MKNQLVLLLISLLIPNLFQAQTNKDVNHSTKLIVLVTDIKKADHNLQDFIKENKLIPLKYITKKKETSISLMLNKSNFFKLKDAVTTWGYIFEEDSKSINYFDTLSKIEHEIELLLNEKVQYSKLVEGIESTSNDRYFNYWDKIISIDKEIAHLKLQKQGIEIDNQKFLFKLNIKEENQSEYFYGNAWINMPGLEYSFLRTEQAVEGITPKTMQGISLKYMFNWYKSYGLVGLYRNFGNSIDSEIDETYIFAYGQDFYSRSLGRGQRKFLNLYISFNLGVYVSSSLDDRLTSWFVNPFIGLELYKTKHILIDNKVGYFLPFKSNRTQRGLMYNFSFNFIL